MRSRAIPSRPRIPDPRRLVVEIDFSAESSSIRKPGRGRTERLQQIGMDDRVVIKKQNEVGSQLQRPSDACIVTAGKSEVAACLEHLDAWKCSLNSCHGLVARTVVDHQYIEARVVEFLQRFQTFKRVIAPVPVQYDDANERCVAPADKRRRGAQLSARLRKRRLDRKSV